MMHVVRMLSLAALLCGLPALRAVAQPATPEQMAGVAQDPGFGTLHMTTRLGSFKLIDGRGRVAVNFTGTIMVSAGTEKLSERDLQIQTSPGLREEYRDDYRVAWTGTGTLIATGSWRGIQWFGRDMDAVWYGNGVARLSGEFDRNLETGSYWYDDPSDVMFFPSEGIIEARVPKPSSTGVGTVRPQRRSE